MDIRKLTTIAAAFSVAGPDLFHIANGKHRDYRCVKCHQDIPPGKPGRECKQCREQRSTP